MRQRAKREKERESRTHTHAHTRTVYKRRAYVPSLCATVDELQPRDAFSVYLSLSSWCALGAATTARPPVPALHSSGPPNCCFPPPPTPSPLSSPSGSLSSLAVLRPHHGSCIHMRFSCPHFGVLGGRCKAKRERKRERRSKNEVKEAPQSGVPHYPVGKRQRRVFRGEWNDRRRTDRESQRIAESTRRLRGIEGERGREG